jgi:hypothetical protein
LGTRAKRACPVFPGKVRSTLPGGYCSKTREAFAIPREIR